MLPLQNRGNNWLAALQFSIPLHQAFFPSWALNPLSHLLITFNDDKSFGYSSINNYISVDQSELEANQSWILDLRSQTLSQESRHHMMKGGGAKVFGVGGKIKDHRPLPYTIYVNSRDI